ncbi:DEAD/DEAH box helicase [Actinomadura physcomitrii]|uniref:DEAD/DEAH box helicase n=1 Tax=Actinomadura physcomitrii TaxID=2650748 RepID=UPI002E2586E5
MLVAHGSWAGDRLVLWAERSGEVTRSTSRAKVRPHPFAASHADLVGAFPEVDGVEGQVTLALPGSAGSPLASPECGVAVSARALRLGRWRVPVLFVAGPEAFALLTDGSVGEKAGASLRYLVAVAARARDLVRRGRVLPQLVRESAGFAARWRPVLTGDDARWFRETAAAMPPVGRAVEEERPSAHVLIEALVCLVDAAVRAALPGPVVGGRRPGARSALPDRWAAALTGTDGSLPGVREDQAQELAAALHGWFADAQALDQPVRTCFRLAEPDGDDDAWRLEFALQSADDLSVYVPAEEVWADGGRAEERLLAGLGRAARLYPALDRALRHARPCALELTTAEAAAFLRDSAALLQAAGFGVRLPAWAGRRRVGLRMTARQRKGPGATTAQGFGLNELLDFRIDLAMDGEPIGEDELAELVRLKVPLVRVRGQWVELDGGQLDAALRAVQERGRGEMTVAEALGEIALAGEEDLPLVEVDADGLLGDLLSGETDRRLAPVPTPETFRGTLRPYQERGLAWLSFLSGLGLGGILADDMGLGKTAQTLALLLAAPGRTLLVCPMSLVGNWQREAERFAPSLRVYVHHGTDRDVALAHEADLVVTTYGTALRDREALAAVEWARVVCDEAQAIKNSAAKQAQAVRAIPAPFRLALTGTPVENHLAELWSLMEFTNPGLLGPARRFRRRFQEPIEARADEEAAAALRRATGPFVLRRLKTDKSIISDLPDKMEMKTWCTLTPEQASLYQAVVEDMMARIDGSEGIERRGNVLAAMTRLKQVCGHPALLLKDGSALPDRSGKLARLEELAGEIVEEGDKALVFTQYAEFGTVLQPHLEARLDRPVLWLHGGLTKRRRAELVDRFQHDDEPMVFLLSLKAAGTGLNLTAAGHVIHLDRWWNPAVENQATDRAFRIGQTRDVQVRKFICLGTLEERIDEMIERKQALAERVVGTGEDWISELSTDRLRDLFALDREKAVT